MWVKLSATGKNPSIPMKFALGILQLAAGFLITKVGMMFVDDAFQVPLLTLFFLYMLHTTGELFLSPIGLSMVTKLSPKSMAGTAMGAWFLSFAIANYVGGKIASLTGGHGDSGEALSAAEGLDKYIGVFSTIGLVLVGISILIMIANKPLKKLMHGVE
jgi:POT family proton-dependent oligopeptide transporter